MIVWLPKPSGDKTGVMDREVIQGIIDTVENATLEAKEGVYYVDKTIDLGTN